MAFTLQGAIKAKFDSIGATAQASLGQLTSNEEDVPGVPGGRVSNFQTASIFWSAATGPHIVRAAIWAKYMSLILR